LYTNIELITELLEFERNTNWRTGHRLKCHTGRYVILAVLLQEFALAVLLQHLNVWSLLTVSNCFIRGQVVHKKTSWVRGIILVRSGVLFRGKNWKTKQNWGAVDKDISVLCVVYTGCEINTVNYQC
jgi:hypothetical protein